MKVPSINFVESGYETDQNAVHESGSGPLINRFITAWITPELHARFHPKPCTTFQVMVVKYHKCKLAWAKPLNESQEN